MKTETTVHPATVDERNIDHDARHIHAANPDGLCKDDGLPYPCPIVRAVAAGAVPPRAPSERG
ncbi:hypothetical protein Afil01_14800 [Actinorhabdospora filicis]|uniref:Uncharacterized protein n=1 Tax=Actinorhabdospora filicis TaxID=1785913 RepID=A0A9W6W870_9ACTN|nr:hypothetical protein [Actinorhabdospora filicis]GLZ76673.1 hypothetical protein Afil01_14800 [Actinorhabdospora filicis]